MKEQQLKEFQVRLDKLSKEFSEMLSEEKTEKTVLTDEDEEGWWINDKNSIVLHKKGQKEAFGIIDFNGVVSVNNWIYCGGNGIWRKATNEEVIKIFTEYFRKQGFVSGKTKFKSAWSGDEYEYKEPLEISDSRDVVSSGKFKGILFDLNKQTIATPIKHSPIMFYGSEVEFNKSGTLAKLGGVWFDSELLETLLPANPEVFQPILDRLERPH